MKRPPEAPSRWSDYGLTAVRWPIRLMGQPDRHNEIELNLLSEGTLTYLFGGRTFTLVPGRLVVFWAVVPHQVVHFEGASHLYWASVPLAWFLQWKLPGPLTRAVIDGHAVPARSDADGLADLARLRQWAADCARSDPDGAKAMLLEVEARLRRLARACGPATAGARSGRTPGPGGTAHWQKAAEMAGFIARNYAAPLWAGDIARSVGLHPNYAMTVFRRAFGVSLMDYVNQHRVSHAQRLLATTDRKILAIAMESGFTTLSWFSAVFRRLAGMSPSSYRASAGSRPGARRVGPATRRAPTLR